MFYPPTLVYNMSSPLIVTMTFPPIVTMSYLLHGDRGDLAHPNHLLFPAARLSTLFFAAEHFARRRAIECTVFISRELFSLASESGGHLVKDLPRDI